MSIHAIKRRATAWLQRPTGVLAALFLLVALTMAGLPVGKVHAHNDADHMHEHTIQLFGDAVADHHDQPDPADPDGMSVLHAHDVVVVATALSELPQLMLGGWVAQAPQSRILVSPPLATRRTPPHRPPIA